MPALAQARPLSAVPVTSRPCPECRGTLLLLSVLPDKPGRMARLYQCHGCAHIEKMVTDAKWLGWLNSELRPPH